DPLGTGENSIGHALIDAKRSFVPLSLVGINLAGIGEKQLFETTLFGIPHVRVQTINKLTAPTETSIVPPATVQSADVSLPAFTLQDRKSTRLNSSHVSISYAVFCLKKKNKHRRM